jgi:hypothetical protein
MTKGIKAFRAKLIHGIAILALAGVALGLAPTTMAEEGGDPQNRISVFERLKQERPDASQRQIVPASAPAGATGWHDKSPEEWHAYHEAQERLRIENGGR